MASVVLGLIFLKHISDAFEERHTWLLKEAANPREVTVRENLRQLGAQKEIHP